MEITSLKEFYEESDKKDIALYQEYLASAKNVVNEGLEEAKKIFGEKDPIIDQIRGQIINIENLETIIKNSMKEIVSNSIAKMSDEELLTIIDTYIDNKKKEYEELSKKYEKLKTKIDESNEKYISEMSDIGYNCAYYEASDTKEFFDDIKSDEDFIMELITSGLNKESLMTKFACLYTKESVQSELAEVIISLQKISKVSDDGVLRRAVGEYLTPERIGHIIGETYEYERFKVFKSLQKKLKMKTEFFSNLPDSLKKELQDNGVVDCQAYRRLALIYSLYKVDKNVDCPQNVEIEMDKAELENVAENVEKIGKKIECATRVRHDRDEMIVFVKSLVDVESDEELTYIHISDEVLEQRRIEYKLNEEINALSEELKKSEETKRKLDILLSKKIISSKNETILEFDILHAQRERERIIDSRENDKEFIEAIVKAERRRLRQFEILSNGIKELKDIQRQIDNVYESRNIIKNITGVNSKLARDLLEKYRKTVEDIYNCLRKEYLLRINVSRNYMDVEDESKQKPRDFDALLASPNVPKYEVNEEFFEEMKAKEIINNYSQSNVNFDFARANVLALKLFKTRKLLNGTYDFEISFAEQEELIHLYKWLVSVYETVLMDREDERKRILNLAKEELSVEFTQLIEDVGRNLTLVTFEDIKEDYEEILKHIRDLKNKIVELRGELPDYDDSQYELLNGFEETYLSSNEVRKIIEFSC